jgi:hypothetical protein
MFTNVSKFLAKHGNIITGRDTVLVSSLTQLGREGFPGYVRSFQDTAKLLKIGNRKGINILPAPFVMLGGCSDPITLRSILEFHAWTRISGVDPDGVLNDAFAVVEHHIKASPGNKIEKMLDMSVKVPMCFLDPKESCVFSEGPTNLPVGVGPVTEKTEKLIISSLVLNLKEVKKLKLDCDISFNRSMANSSLECLDYLVVGGSSADKLTSELASSGAKCQHLLLPNYRASSFHAGKLREGLSKHSVGAQTVIVLQCFDDAAFMTATEEGGLLPLSKDPQGVLHCFGDLVYTPKELLWKIFSQAADELKEHKSNVMVILSPLPRFMESSCCTNEEHMPNRMQKNFKKSMEDVVFQWRTHLKDFAFRQGLRRARTVSTWNLVRKGGATWADPLHLDQKGYANIAVGVVAAAEEMKNKRPGGPAEGMPPPKKQKANNGGNSGGSISSPGPQPGGSRGGPQPGRGGARGGIAHHQYQRAPPTRTGDFGGGGNSSNRGWSRGQRRGRGAMWRRYN